METECMCSYTVLWDTSCYELFGTSVLLKQLRNILAVLISVISSCCWQWLFLSLKYNFMTVVSFLFFYFLLCSCRPDLLLLDGEKLFVLFIKFLYVQNYLRAVSWNASVSWRHIHCLNSRLLFSFQGRSEVFFILSVNQLRFNLMHPWLCDD